MAGAWVFVAIQAMASRWTLYRMVLGMVLIAVVLLVPQGLAGTVGSWVRSMRDPGQVRETEPT
ncbi:MAG: hypothetical protein HY660_14570 [Armatimonadetes bacterium]|nr:hypothetical protein [Armatimonadota bacterium]